MFHVTEINRLEELQTFQLAWEELWHRGRCKRFQMSYHWLKAYWESSTDRELKVLIVSLAGKVIGLMPLIIKKAETRLGTQRVLTYPLDQGGNWYGPVGPNSAATLTACLRYLAGAPRDWDLLDLPYIDRDRLDLGRTLTAARNIGWPATERIWQEIPQIELTSSWTEFLNQKRPEVLTEILAAEQAVTAAGRIALVHYRSDSQSEQVQLSALLADWKSLLNAAGRARDFSQLESFAVAADKQNQLELNVLSVAGMPVAATLGYVFEGQVEIVQSVCLPQLLSDFAKILPHQLESVLLGRTLEAALLRGDSCYEVTASSELSGTAKTLWSTEILQSYRYSMAPWNHVRSSLLVRYHAACSPAPLRRKVKLAKPQLQTHSLAEVEDKPSTAPALKVFG